MRIKLLPLLAAASAVLCACSRDAATEVTIRLTDIYEDVLGRYRSAARQGTLPDQLAYEQKYFTERYLKACTEQANEEGIIDCDPWVQGQDWPICVHATIDKVTEITRDSVVAQVTIYNFEPVGVNVIMRRERDNWFIDGFEPR